MSDRTLPFTVNLDWSTVNWVKQHRYALTLNASKKINPKIPSALNFVVIGALRVNRAKQLNRRRHIRLVCPVNVPRSLNCLQTHWLYTIAHWSGPPRTYVDFSQDQQGRLVYVRTAVAATCINI